MPNGDPVPTDPVVENPQSAYPTALQKLNSVKIWFAVGLFVVGLAIGILMKFGFVEEVAKTAAIQGLGLIILLAGGRMGK
jgi:hypothetical protein